MRFLPPLVLHGAHQVSDDALADHAQTFAGRLSDWPAWPELDEVAECPTCEVPQDARRAGG
jgi:glutathione-regulated potassium-efflux system ancillary protein KefF